MAHKTEVHRVRRKGRRVRATCPCGWRGPSRNHHGSAASDGMGHEEAEQAARLDEVRGVYAGWSGLT